MSYSLPIGTTCDTLFLRHTILLVFTRLGLADLHAPFYCYCPLYLYAESQRSLSGPRLSKDWPNTPCITTCIHRPPASTILRCDSFRPPSTLLVLLSWAWSLAFTAMWLVYRLLLHSFVLWILLLLLFSALGFRLDLRSASRGARLRCIPQLQASKLSSPSFQVYACARFSRQYHQQRFPRSRGLALFRCVLDSGWISFRGGDASR
ncbi:hypothetical protein C8R45DRAFT_553782 [Mycena sanguinolenta]|nr:hypothetical protein C8R45DRAFT_553782 [Mycena sanguinolenta]